MEYFLAENVFRLQGIAIIVMERFIILNETPHAPKKDVSTANTRK